MTSSRSKKKSNATARTKKKRASLPPSPTALATVAAGPPDPSVEKTEQTPPFVPSAAQLAYAYAVRALAEEGTRPSDVVVAKRLKCSRTTIWSWRQDEGFQTWIAKVFGLADDVEWLAAKARCLGLAIQGSVRHFEAYARVRTIGQKGGGFTTDGVAGETNVTNYTLNILVPRPPELPAEGGV